MDIRGTNDDADFDESVASSPYVITDPTWRSGLGGSRLVMDVDDYEPWEAVLTNTNGPFDAMNLAAFRASRHGGDAQADHSHRDALTKLVGTVGIMSGHIEAEMKRILLVSQGGKGRSFADVDFGWGELEKRLAKVAQRDTPLASKLLPVLAWGKEHGIKEFRDTVIHSEWCMFDIGHFQASRFFRKGDGSTVVDSLADLAKKMQEIIAYRNALSQVVQFPACVYPPLPDDVAGPSLKIFPTDR